MDPVMDDFPLYSCHPSRHSKPAVVRSTDTEDGYRSDPNGMNLKSGMKTLSNLDHRFSDDDNGLRTKNEINGRSRGHHTRNSTPKIEKCEGFHNMLECVARHDSDLLNTGLKQLVSKPCRLNILDDLQPRLPMLLNYERRPKSYRVGNEDECEKLKMTKCFHQSLQSSAKQLDNFLNPKEWITVETCAQKRWLYQEIREPLYKISHNNIKEAHPYTSLQSSLNDGQRPPSSTSMIVTPNYSKGRGRRPSLTCSSMSIRSKRLESSNELLKEVAKKSGRRVATLAREAVKLCPHQVESLGSLSLDVNGNPYSECTKSKSAINIGHVDIHGSPRSDFKEAWKQSDLPKNALAAAILANTSNGLPVSAHAETKSRKSYMVMDCCCSIPSFQSQFIKRATCDPSNNCTGTENACCPSKSCFCPCPPCPTFCGMSSCCPRLEKLTPTIRPREYCSTLKPTPVSSKPSVRPPPRPNKRSPPLPPKSKFMKPLPPTPERVSSNHIIPPGSIQEMYNPCMYSCDPCQYPGSYIQMEYPMFPPPTIQYLYPAPPPERQQYPSQYYQQPYSASQFNRAFSGMPATSQPRSRFSVRRSQSRLTISQHSRSTSPMKSIIRRKAPAPPPPTSTTQFGMYQCNCPSGCCICFPTATDPVPKVPPRRLRRKRSSRRNKTLKCRIWKP